MTPAPEALARQDIDAQLAAAGWAIQNVDALNVAADRGVAVREFPLASGHGYADYILYVDGQVVGVVEAKKSGSTLTGVELQSAKYSMGLPARIPAPIRPLPFLYQATGVETRFTNRLDPVPRSRDVFGFHRPGTLATWLAADPLGPAAVRGPAGRVSEPGPPGRHPATLRGRLTVMPPIDPRGLWPAQLQAVGHLEASLAEARPRALVQMATGAGKTFTAVSSIYRLIKFAGAARVLFLVDRANLGRQALKEFQRYRTPDDGRLFTELYNVQLLTSNTLDPVACVVIGTVQRLYSMLKGEPDFVEEADEASPDDVALAVGGLTAAGLQEGSGAALGLDALRKQPLPVVYSATLPPETFDVVFVDESHRSIYTLWRQVVEYWDAFLVGLTATPSKLTYGFFDGNVVQEYDHARAVADGVNVDFDVYRIRTEITEHGATVDAGEWVDKRDRETRAKRWEQLDEVLSYDAAALDRDVVTPDQLRTVVRAFKQRFLPEVFPERTHIPKTLVFAKDDSHADDIVKTIREELGLGNDAVVKITYRTTGVKPETLLQSFRNSYYPRIAVTVDMIATGTDVKPLEVLWFMRTVRSRTLFEQMKGRGVRVIKGDDLKAVTPDAAAKSRFVLVDCVGVCEEPLADTRPLERQPTVSLDALLRAVAMGSVEPDVLSSLASRLARLDAQLGTDERAALTESAHGTPLRAITGGIVDALDPDRQIAAARATHGLPPNVDPSDAQVAAARAALLRAAAAPLAGNPPLRQRLVDLKRSKEQVIDRVSVDALLSAGLSAEARERAAALTTSFEAFCAAYQDEIVALRLLLGSDRDRRLTREAVEELAKRLAEQKPPLAPLDLWRAYETLDRTRVRGAATRLLTDVVSLVRFAVHRDEALAPFPEVARARFAAWLAGQEARGRAFTAEQRAWLEAMRDHVAANLEIGADDLDYSPFAQRGGLGAAYRVFGKELPNVLDEVAEVIAA